MEVLDRDFNSEEEMLKILLTKACDCTLLEVGIWKGPRCSRCKALELGVTANPIRRIRLGTLSGCDNIRCCFPNIEGRYGERDLTFVEDGDFELTCKCSCRVDSFLHHFFSTSGSNIRSQLKFLKFGG